MLSAFLIVAGVRRMSGVIPEVGAGQPNKPLIAEGERCQDSQALSWWRYEIPEIYMRALACMRRTRLSSGDET